MTDSISPFSLSMSYMSCDIKLNYLIKLKNKNDLTDSIAILTLIRCKLQKSLNLKLNAMKSVHYFHFRSSNIRVTCTSYVCDSSLSAHLTGGIGFIAAKQGIVCFVVRGKMRPQGLYTGHRRNVQNTLFPSAVHVQSLHSLLNCSPGLQRKLGSVAVM